MALWDACHVAGAGVLISTDLGMKVAHSMSVCTPCRGTCTLTMVWLCYQKQVVSTLCFTLMIIVTA